MAKNITQFAPGMSGSVSLGEANWCVSVFKAGNGCHINNGPRGPNYGGHGWQWTVPDGVTQAKFMFVSNGSNTGGSCCCANGPPSVAGASGIFDVTVEAGEQWCFCQSAGNCCVAGVAGQQGCNFHIYNVTNAEQYYFGNGASCMCAVCNYFANTNCDEYCFGAGTGRCWNSDKDNNNISPYGCRACSEGSAKKAQWDSDETIFRPKQGFSVTPCCWAGIAQHCGTAHFIGLNHFLTNKQHHVGSPVTKTDNEAGQQNNCKFYRGLWGGGNPSYGAGGICQQGAGAPAAITSGGACCCGGPGGPAMFHLWYK
jgi:hypothetical protein